MHKKFEITWTKIKGGCQSGRKVVTHDSKSDFPLAVSCKNAVNPTSFSYRTVPYKKELRVYTNLTDPTPGLPVKVPIS